MTVGLLLFGSGVLADEVQLTLVIGSPDDGFWNQLYSPSKFAAPTAWTTLGSTLADAAGTTSDGIAFGSLTELTGTATHLISQKVTKPSAASLTYTLKARIKLGAFRTRASLVLTDSNVGGNGAFVCFDLANARVGVVATVFGTGFSAASSSLSAIDGDGFYTCSLTVTTNTNASLWCQLQGDGAANLSSLNNTYAGNTSGVAYYFCDFTLVQSVANGNVLSNLTDDDPNTTWQASSSTSWAGFDAGLSVAFTGFAFAPSDGQTWAVASFNNPAYDYDQYTKGSLAQLSNDATFATGVSTVDTIPAAPDYPRFDFAERPITGSSRYFRLRQRYGNLSGLKAFARYTAGITARPMKPTISPWGGRFPAGSQTVTITSRTLSAQIYYTADGTTPDNTKTLYAGPFSLSMGGVATTVKAIAYDTRQSTVYSEVSTAFFTPWAFKPNEDWYDDKGILIEAHSGNVIYVASKALYYWVGGSANKYTNSSMQFGVPRQDIGLQLYSSPDLYNWTKVGQILQTPSGITSLTRPHVVLNPNNNTFVIWAHGDPGTFTTTSGVACIATSLTIDSGWSWQNTSYQPAGVNAVRDLCLFVDDNGDGYAIFADGTQSYQISKLAADYLSAASTIAPTATGTGVEAPVMFKVGSQYFYVSSNSFSYLSDPTLGPDFSCYTTTTPMTAASWVSQVGAFTGAGGGKNTIFQGQPSFILKPQGKTQLIFGMDHWWNATDLYHSRQTWVPITIVSPTSMQATFPASWDLSNLT